ncbi:MAG: hypothetical protein ABI662_03695 [Dermatophilaceae bacterium]
MMVEERLTAVRDAIEGATQQVLRYREANRRRKQEEAARCNEVERIAKLRNDCETWEAALSNGAQIWRQHVQLREFMSATRSSPIRATQGAGSNCTNSRGVLGGRLTTPWAAPAAA